MAIKIVRQAAQQGAAPDRLQLRSLRSFLAAVSALPAAGELGRWPASARLLLAERLEQKLKVKLSFAELVQR